MDWLRVFLKRCRAMGQARTLDAELEEELQSHIDLAGEENLRHGSSEQEARTSATPCDSGAPRRMGIGKESSWCQRRVVAPGEPFL